MPDSEPSDVTELLIAAQGGSPDAVSRLMPLVYTEFKRLAAGYLRAEPADHTLQTTGLVHEACLKLVDQRSTNWKNRSHFFGIAAQAMRRILVDHARNAAYTTVAAAKGKHDQRSRDLAAALVRLYTDTGRPAQAAKYRA